MKHGYTFLIAAAVVFGMSMQYAEADNPWKGRIGGLRSIGSSRLLQGGANRVLQNSGRSIKLPNLSSSIRNSGSRSNLAEGLGRLGGSSRGQGLGRFLEGSRGIEGLGRSGNPGIGAFGEALRVFGDHEGYGSGGFGYSDRYRYENEMADAYRDAAIANAVVGLVGIMVSAAQQPQYTAVAAAPMSVAPAPVSVAPPPGRWERRTVVVQPARYETYQEWIPEIYDSRTGAKIGGGYYESRSKLVPETYQYQDVWVAP
jgi:hypothetical protein